MNLRWLGHVERPDEKKYWQADTRRGIFNSEYTQLFPSAADTAVYSALCAEDFTEALITLAASGLSDILDGRIARKYDMVTDLGKVLDPVADKLTQCAMMLCVAMRYPAMWWLLGLHVVKETVMLIMGWYVLKRTDTVNSAIWAGKLCTGVIYAVMMLHVILPHLPQPVSVGCTIVCAGLIVLSLIVYTARYVKILGGKK